jgi:DNA-binding transcriptional MocR family regulator
MNAKSTQEAYNLSPLKTWEQRKSLGQHVFDTLKLAIINGDLAAGQRLVESRVADDLDLSRTPVREAMHKLEREGFLEKLPRGGFVVLGLNRQDIEETFGIRSVLESYAARLAAEKHAQDELDGLQRKIDAYQAHLDRGDLAPLPEINTEFPRSAVCPEPEPAAGEDDQRPARSNLSLPTDHSQAGGPGPREQPRSSADAAPHGPARRCRRRGPGA